jgi:hypothetical protein
MGMGNTYNIQHNMPFTGVHRLKIEFSGICFVHTNA